VHHDPLDAVRGPEADAIAAADAESPQAAGDLVRRGVQFRPGEALFLVARGHRQPVGEARSGQVQQVADGEIEEPTIGPPSVAPGFDWAGSGWCDPGLGERVRLTASYSAMKGQFTPQKHGCRVIEPTGFEWRSAVPAHSWEVGADIRARTGPDPISWFSVSSGYERWNARFRAKRWIGDRGNPRIPDIRPPAKSDC
jgi:hypothetical protein